MQNSKQVLRRYSAFLITVTDDTEEAQKLLNRAEGNKHDSWISILRFFSDQSVTETDIENAETQEMQMHCNGAELDAESNAHSDNNAQQYSMPAFRKMSTAMSQGSELGADLTTE